MSKAYNNYILDHRTAVKQAYNWLVSHGIIKDIYEDRINSHDISKFGEDEYGAYDDYFYGKKSPEVNRAFDRAWLHHIHNNPHHWQHWLLHNDDGKVLALEMPEEYLIEMLCDHFSFAFRKGDLYELFIYYDQNKDKIKMHHATRRRYESLLAAIRRAIRDEEKAAGSK